MCHHRLLKCKIVLIFFIISFAVAIGTSNIASTNAETGLSPKAGSSTDTPPAKLVQGAESGAHIPKEPFRRRKVSEIRRKDSSSGPEASGASKPLTKKKTVSSGSGSTQEITITRVTHPKKVESAVIEVQTDFDDDDIREIKVIPGISSRFAPSTSIGTDNAASASGSYVRRSTKTVGNETTFSPILCESETQVESTEIGVQHAEVGIGTDTEPPQVSKKTTVDIGIQTGNPEEHEHHESPRMMSIAIQAEEEEETMKSVGVGDSPPPQETVVETLGGRATTRSRQRTQPETPTIESLPVSLSISGLSRYSGSQNGQSKTDSNNKKQKSKSSHSSSINYDDSGDINKESQESSSSSADDQSSKARHGRGRGAKSQRRKGAEETESPSSGREQSTASEGSTQSGNSPSVTIEPATGAGAAHVSVIKRTPEKRGGSRPFGRPKDLPLHAPTIDTAQIASLLSESPPESEKGSKKAKSPGRSPGRSPAARSSDRQPSGPSKNKDQQDGNADWAVEDCRLDANVIQTVADVHVQENFNQPQEPPPQKKKRGRPPKKIVTTSKRPVGRPRKNRTIEIPKTVEIQNEEKSDGSECGSPKRKKSKSAASDESGSPTRSSSRKGTNEEKSPIRSSSKRTAEKVNNKVQNKKKRFVVMDDEDADSEVEEINKRAEDKSKNKKKVRKMLIPPAFPEKDPYDFDALSVSDFEPLPDLRMKRKRRKSKGFDFELETRRKKKKKKKPSTPEDR